MAVAIHHGAPGSYKTFALVMRFVLDALFTGRVVFTNVRGLDSIDKIKDAFLEQSYFDKLLNKPLLKVHPDSRLYYIDTGTVQGRFLFATWYKWLPLGALLVIDEAQMIYPDRADFKLEHLDKVVYTDSIIEPLRDSSSIIDSGLLPIVIDDLTNTIKEGRPHDCFTAFDKHRHYNWDIYLSTPNIAKVKRDIREVAEYAYRHRSLSDISRLFKNQWYEHQHDPENNGKSDTQRIGSPKRYHADKRVFNCYSSTTTGNHIASKAGTGVFSDGAIRFKFAVVFIAIALCSYSFYSSIQQKKHASDIGNSTNQQGIQIPRNDTAQAINNALSASAPVQATPIAPQSLESPEWHISAVVRNKVKGTMSIYAINTHGNVRRLNPSICRFDDYGQPLCMLDGLPVTLYSGHGRSADSSKVLVSSNM